MERVEVKVAGESSEEAEAAIDADVKAFEKFLMENSGSSPLIKAERAILKTYMIYKSRKRF